MTVTVALPPTHKACILAHADAALPEECCGLLIGHRETDGIIHITDVIESDNLSEGDKSKTFEIDPALLLRIQRESRDTPERIVGYYHSHPDGSARPSATDRAGVWEEGQVWLIVGIDKSNRTQTCAAFLTITKDGEFDFVPVFIEAP